MTNYTIKDIRKTQVFPDLTHRNSKVEQTEGKIMLERDYLGENPLHYVVDLKKHELVVANNISDIKHYLESDARRFVWERVRAVSNNTRAVFADPGMLSAAPLETEVELPLQEYKIVEPVDVANLPAVGDFVRSRLAKSIDERLITINDQQVGLLLSGGLDSMSVGYLLAQKDRPVIAYTLKVRENDPDVVKSRELAKHFGIDLVEVSVKQSDGTLSLSAVRYSPQRAVIVEKVVADNIVLDDLMQHTLEVMGNPKKDNVYCGVAMNLIARAISGDGIKTVFCGEGPNEMINDYGFNPKEHGYDTDDKGNVAFREALTFGLKKSDLQHGRGGLAKHATARMGKVFAEHGIRLEAPYFDKDIAKVLCCVPHLTSYDTIKQHIVGAMFAGQGLNQFIAGTSKEKFQDGSGLSSLLDSYPQEKLLDFFEKIYGIRKVGYLR